MAASLGFGQLTTFEVAAEEWDKYTNADGSGLAFEMLKAVYVPRGITPTIKMGVYKNAIRRVQTKQSDAVIGPYMGEVDKGAVYPKYAIDSDNIQVVYPKASKIAWKGVETITNKRVAYMEAYYDFQKYITTPFKHVNIEWPQINGFRMVASGKADFYMEEGVELDLFWNKAGNQKYYPAENWERKTVAWLPTYVVFADTDTGKELAKIWNEEFPKLVKSGKIKEISVKWNGDEESYKETAKATWDFMK
jgi:ABC-type amino acid transport substrate-binding protein